VGGKRGVSRGISQTGRRDEAGRGPDDEYGEMYHQNWC
jgi:hypothetical protein